MIISLNKSIIVFTNIFLMMALLLPYFFNINFFVIELLFILFAFFVCALFHQKFYVSKTSKLWIFPLLFSVISSMFSIDLTESLKYCLLIFFLVIMISFGSIVEHRDNTVGMIGGFTGIHVLFSLWQYIDSSSFYSFFIHFASPETLEANTTFFRYGRICGITEQTSVNGFILSLFLIIFFQKALVERRNVYKIVLFSFVLIAFMLLALTGKRIFIVSVLLIICCIWYFYADNISLKKRIILILASLVLGSVFISVVIKNNMILPIILKFQSMQNSGDISNGRFDLWLETITVFKRNPILGIGPNCIKFLLENNSHNIYLELLADVGILGAVSFYIAILYPVFYSCKMILVDKIINSNILFSAAFQIFFIIYGFTGNPLFDHKIMWIYTLALIMYESERKKYEPI